MSVNESPPTGHEDADPPLLPAVAKTLVFGILLAAIWFTLRGRRAQDAGQPVRRPPRQKAAARPAPRTPPESVSPVEAAPPARPRPRKRRRSQPPSAFTVALGIGLILAVSWVGILYMRGHIGGDGGVDTVIDPAEQLALGRACYLGDGKAQDKIKAAIWFGRAAGQGNGEAQFLLGSMWADGDGLPQDAFEAAFWLRKAAAQDVPGAKALLEKIARKAAERPRLDADPQDAAGRLALGRAYEEGDGVPWDAAQAAVWYRKAAEQGNAEARRRLGLLYEKGKGVRQDAAQAAVWYRKAAAQGDAEARYRLGRLHAAGQGVPQDKDQAVGLYLQAAKQDHYPAQRALAYVYAAGGEHTRNREKERFWHDKATAELTRRAQAGDEEAQFHLGLTYESGDGVERFPPSAAYWFTKAAMQGNAEAQQCLGSIYRRGDGVRRDAYKALFWYRKAAEQGSVTAQVALNEICVYTRQGLLRWDCAQASNLMEARARHEMLEQLVWRAESGDAEAQLVLGTLCFLDSVVKRNML